MKIAEVLKVLADETRLRMLNLLVEAGDLCGCELEALLGLSQSNASRHLTRLRQAGLIEAEKRGQWVHFRATAYSTDQQEFVWRALRSARQDIPAMVSDMRRLEDYRKGPYECTTIKEWTGARRDGVGQLVQ